MIDLVESGLADAIEYADIQSRIEDISAAITIQRYGPVWTEHDTEPTRDGDEFDAVIAGAFLLRVYLDGVSDIEIERLADESGGDVAWITVAVSGNASLIDLDIAPSLVADGLTARVFYYSTDGVIKYMENTDISANAFTAPVVVGAVADVIYLAAVSLTKVYYITENSNNNRVLHVYELNGAWANTDSDIYWPYLVHAFDAVTFETGRDLLVLATDLPPLIGSRVVGAEVTQEVNQVQGIVTFWASNGRWSDHDVIDVIDKVEADLSRTSLRLSFYNSTLFGAYLRCGGTEDYPYSKAAVIKSKDGVNWEFPELIDNFMPPFAMLPRTDYLYAVGVNKVLRSPCCAWAGQTPVELDVTQYVVGLESSAAEIRNSQVRLSNPADVLASTLATENARLQIVYDLGYVVGGSNLRVRVSTEDLISRRSPTALPHQGIGLTTRDFLGRVNRVRSDHAAEWPGIQAGRDTYNDPSETGYGGLRHTAPYRGSWKTPGDEELHLISSNKECLAVSTFVTDALNGSAETAFQVNTTGNSEYAGIAFRTFDKDNLHFLIYDQNTDKIKLVRGIGTDDDADDERDDATLATSNSIMSWSVDTWYWLKVVVRYSLVYAFYSTDGITWVPVTWAGGGGTSPIELSGRAGYGDDDYNVVSGRFGLIGYGYSASDSWPPYTPPPWTPPMPPGSDKPVKACVGWTQDQLGYTADLLLHHHAGTATAGTAGIALHDSDADFVALGIAIGDVVEEMGTAPVPANITTVAAVVSATQLTLTAGIGLVPTSEYHVCGTQWVNAKGTIAGTILHFIPITTGASTVGAWVLTDTGVYYTPNILTPSPTWTLKLTIAQAAAGCVGATTGATEFRWIHGYANEPGYAIVSLAHADALNPTIAHLGGYVHTHDYGGTWTWASMPIGSNRRTGFSQLEVSENTGKIWGRRSHGWPPGESRLYYSADLGGTFAYYNAQNLGDPASDFHQEIYNPYSAGDNTLYMDRYPPWLAGDHLKSTNSGSFFNAMVAAGYTPVSGKSGAAGWKDDADDILMMWKKVSDGHSCLLRSRTGGAAWTEAGDADDLFGGPIGLYSGAVALISSTWAADEDVLLWVGLQVGNVGNTQICRIRYTQDGGAAWYNKTGNWYTVLTNWSGGSGASSRNGNVGCCPLPRIGDNS